MVVNHATVMKVDRRDSNATHLVNVHVTTMWKADDATDARRTNTIDTRDAWIVQTATIWYGMLPMTIATSWLNWRVFCNKLHQIQRSSMMLNLRQNSRPSKIKSIFWLRMLSLVLVAVIVHWSNVSMICVNDWITYRNCSPNRNVWRTQRHKRLNWPVWMYRRLKVQLKMPAKHWT